MCQLLMEERDVWEVVHGTFPRPVSTTATDGTVTPANAALLESWNKKNSEAVRIISFTVSQELQGPIRMIKVAKEAWEELQKVYASKDKQRKYNLLRKLYRIDMIPGSSLAEHERTFGNIVESLAAMGRNIETEDLVLVYANSLPQDEYGTWLQSQASILDQLSLSDFKGRVREEQQRKLNLESTNFDPRTVTAHAANYGKSQGKGRGQSSNGKASERRPGKCNHCGIKGHWARECRKRIAEEGGSESEQARPKRDGSGPGGGRTFGGLAYTFASTTSEDQQQPRDPFGGLAYTFNAAKDPSVRRNPRRWVKDCGATHHMNSDRSQFFEFRRLKRPIYVGGISKGLPAVGVGKVRIADDCGRTRILSNVLYIPKLKNNLLSITKTTLDGWRSVFENGGCTTTHGDNFRIYTPIQDGLCIFTSTPSVMQALAAAAPTGSHNRKITITDWHERLGHVSKTAILKLGNRVEGLAIDPTDSEEFPECQCAACAAGKLHRQPFDSVEVRAEKPLQLVHSDLCGKFPINSLNGGKYFITFTDDCTRYCRVYILRNKEAATVLSAFKEYRAWAEKQTGFEIKAIRTDGGKEYHKEMEKNLKGTGIEHQCTAAYSSQSNGVSERMNRTLMDMVGPMLEGSGAPSMLWGEAVVTACYIKNRLSTRALEKGKTPYEAWTGKKPYLGHIRKFGCTVYAHVPKKIRKRLDSKSLKGILVGYESESGLYRVYHPQKRRITTSRDLIICEDEFAYGNKVPTFIPERSDGEILDEITPNTSDTAPAATVDTSEFVEFPTPPPTPTATTTPASSPSVTPEVEEARPIYDEIEVLPLPAPTPVADVQRSDNPVISNYGLRNRPAISYKGMLAFGMLAGKRRCLVGPKTFADAMDSDLAEQWKAAMDVEMESIHKNNTWELVPPPKKGKIVGSRWVLHEKEKGFYKARFCAKGYTQQWGEDYDETFAPVAKYTSIRTLFALSAGGKSKIHQMDVKTAFLYSNLGETVYVRQPEGYEVPGKEHWVCRLNKALYGLKQSTRAWFGTIAPALLEFEFEMCESDHSIFVHTNKKGLKTYIALYVDDFLISSEDEGDLAEIKRRLSERFEMKDMGVARKFLGIEIEYGEDGSVKIHQEQYIRDILARHGMSECNPVSTPLDTSIKLATTTDSESLANQKHYQMIVGELMFAAIATRPDIMCAVGQLSQFNSNPSSKHLFAAKRVLRYLQGTLTLGITYRLPPVKLTGLTDADWAGDINTRRSTTGYVVMLNNGAIAWRSKRQVTVALSTTEAEYMALTEATKELKWMRQFLTELGQGPGKEATVLCTDNQGAIALAKNPVSHAKSKHIDIRHHFIRDAVMDKIIWLQYVPTEEMTADSLTKALSRQKHEKCAIGMGMTL